MLIYYAHHGGQLTEFEAEDETETLDRREGNEFVKSITGNHYPRGRCYRVKNDALRHMLREKESSRLGIRREIKEQHDELRRINQLIEHLNTELSPAGKP